MRVLWTLVKVVVALAVAIPLSIIVLATGLGILGTLVGLAVLTIKLAVLALCGYGVFRLFAAIFGGLARSTRQPTVAHLPPVDRHYEAAMRELDEELGEVRR